ncbi:MAG TPA: amidohydrolase family protein [Candidatus Binatia bacterium]|jgi:imidazolonepropionase-like amidohydrolase|nr:amidohydrolase family protein [Candidatus Binatia bacterium]
MRAGTRRAVWALGIVVAILVIVVGTGVLALRPPTLAVPSQGLVLSEVTVVDPGRDRRAKQTVSVEGEKIARIAESTVQESAGTNTGRFAGAYVLPGLIDMHVHFMSYPDRDLFALLFLAHGVTTVRDTGNFDGSIWQTQQAILAGQIPGPRIFACGPILDGDPPVWPQSRVVRTAEEAEAAVAEAAAHGANCIKAYSLLSPQALTAIHQAAAKRGLPVIGHVPLAVPFEQAHLTDVQHLTGVPPLFQIPTTDFIRAIATAWHALDATRSDAIIRASVEQNIAHTPTLVVAERLSRLLELQQNNDATSHLLPRYYRELLWNPQEGLPYMRGTSAQDAEALKQEIPKMKQFVRRLHQAGVRIHAGTDTPNPFVVPGASLQEELRLLVEAGFTPEEAWIAATRTAGESLREPKLGSIEEGAPADFLIFRDDPTKDLAALATLEAVVAQGRLYPKETLDQALTRWRRHFDNPLYDAVSMAIARFMMKRMFTRALTTEE